MSLPPQLVTPELSKLQKWLDETPNPLRECSNPTAQDAQAIGIYVMHVSAVELNLRRLIRGFGERKLLSEKYSTNINFMTVPASSQR